MRQINAINFAPFARRGVLGTDTARDSLEKMAARTGANHVILTPAGLQERAYTDDIDFSGAGTPADDELCTIIKAARALGLKVILKPTVNCKDGTWRAFINFFDKEVVCEPKWSRWFASHERFQLHYAKIAEETGCVMFILGCEMVMAERKEEHWRGLVAAAKALFHGPVSYNTDKYQEDAVTWWDCVDVISSSGYYPAGHWEAELDRVEAVVKRFGKPFFFAETGCMSAAGSSRIPNDWHLHGNTPAAGEQADWYLEMFACTKKRPWVEGYGLWSWAGALPYAEDAALKDTGYELYAKPAEKVVREYFEGGRGLTL
jgi:hypothetical protein